MILAGHYSPAGQSSHCPARLELGDDGRVSIVGSGVDGERVPFEFGALDVSDRLGNTTRLINFPDGGCFETNDNSSVDQWLSKVAPMRLAGILHMLESKLRFAVPALVLVVAFCYGFATFALPWLSGRAAYALPVSVCHSLGQGTYGVLEEHFLTTSNLSVKRQRALQALFKRYAPVGSGFQYSLHFSGGENLGANALALADGSIIVTDELVELASNDLEIVGVLLHEIGHVEKRHGLKSAIQSSALTLIMVSVFGDINSASSLLATLPTVLMQSSYSRGMESEADRFAVGYMLRHDLDAVPFIDMLEKLQGDDEHFAVLKYVTSHPMGEDRLEPLRRIVDAGR